MGLIDFFVTPLYVVMLYLFAAIYKSANKKDFLIQRYFLSSYFLRIVGGIAFGCVYFFYYGGGDTFNYHWDSMIFSSAIKNDPGIAYTLYFEPIDVNNPETTRYVAQLIFKTDPAAHFMARLAGVINLFTFDSFLSTTILFSLIGFWGSWKLFLTLCRMFPSLHKELSYGCLYLPSILFWTSGIMKDTLCTAALCFLFSALIEMVLNGRWTIKVIGTIVFTVFVLQILKVYILLCFIPTISIYLFSILNQKIKMKSLRMLAKPFLIAGAIGIGYFGVSRISSDDTKYNLESLEHTAQVTADWIGGVSLRSGGSYYSLGELDFSITNIPNLTIKAFIVTFYRPFIWELKSPLMIFSTLEGFYFLYLTYIFLKHVIKRKFKNILTPFTRFCFLFAIIFAFVVGVTSNNFGTLARYKSLMLPFFVCGVYVTVKLGSQQKKSSNYPHKEVDEIERNVKSVK